MGEVIDNCDHWRCKACGGSSIRVVHDAGDECWDCGGVASEVGVMLPVGEDPVIEDQGPVYVNWDRYSHYDAILPDDDESVAGSKLSLEELRRMLKRFGEVSRGE